MGIQRMDYSLSEAKLICDNIELFNTDELGLYEWSPELTGMTLQTSRFFWVRYHWVGLPTPTTDMPILITLEAAPVGIPKSADLLRWSCSWLFDLSLRCQRDKDCFNCLYSC